MGFQDGSIKTFWLNGRQDGNTVHKMVSESADLDGNYSGYLFLDGNQPNITNLYTPIKES